MFWLGKSIQSGGSSGSESDIEKKQGLSPIEFLILAHLRSREMRNKNKDFTGQYGYELIQELNRLFAGSWEAQSGTIYPILTKLDKNKRFLIGDEKPSPLGPVKKVYSLTDSARNLIDSIIKEKFESDLDFMLHYIELLTPFISTFSDADESGKVFDKIMQIPAKSIALTVERATTEVDHDLKVRKLEKIKDSLENIIRNIEVEIKK